MATTNNIWLLQIKLNKGIPSRRYMEDYTMLEYDDEMTNEMIGQFAGETRIEPEYNILDHIPFGNGDGSEFQTKFLESMRKAKTYGWTLSANQNAKLADIIAQQAYNDEIENSRCYRCEYEGGLCETCFDEKIALEEKQYAADTAHMTCEQLDDFHAYMEEINHRDVASGSFGSVRSFSGPCPLSYDPRGYAHGQGYAVYVDRYGNKH